MDWIRPVSCERRNEISGFIKSVKFRDWLSYFQLIKYPSPTVQEDLGLSTYDFSYLCP
jgi:hypothetical protein